MEISALTKSHDGQVNSPHELTVPATPSLRQSEVQGDRRGRQGL